MPRAKEGAPGEEAPLRPPVGAMTIEPETEQPSEDLDAMPEEEIDALLAVAQLDLEIAAAYAVALEAVDGPVLRELFLRFMTEHHHHVERISELARDHDVNADIVEPEPSRSVLLALAANVGGLDAGAALEVMIAAERLAKGAYETVLWLVTDEPAVAMVERHRENQRRHLAALLAHAKRDAG